MNSQSMKMREHGYRKTNRVCLPLGKKKEKKEKTGEGLKQEQK